MGFVRHIIGLIAAFLFSVLSAVAMPMASTASHKAGFFPLHAATAVEHTNVHFAARAPPITVPSVAVTGDVTVLHGGAFVTHGVKTQWASLNFGVDHIATNRTGALFGPSTVVTSRVDELTAQIPENSRGRITMGVAVVEDAAGNRQVLVSTSEPNGYLRPGVNLREGETLVSGPRGSHAEADIVRYAEENDLTIVDIGATRPVCSGCQGVIPDGTNISTPLK